jgi:drug/metabolite transporter (DMT)-like permease
MIDSIPPWLWIVFTLLAAGSQVARNAMQRNLTSTLGTTGATHVRFLYGLPFAAIFLLITWAVTDSPPLHYNLSFFLWLLLGAMSQIVATAWMLNAMQSKSFVVTTAAIKTEPVQVAVFGAALLGERIGTIGIIAVVIATAGVVMMSWPRSASDHGSTRDSDDHKEGTNDNPQSSSWWPIVVGMASGGMFALSSVGFRGAILSLAGDAPMEIPFYVRATTTLACGLLLQTVVLSAYLAWRRRSVLIDIFRSWRPAMLAGLAGAVASQFWFLAFSIETVSKVRTLALVEVLFAQIISRKLFSQKSSFLETAGITLIVIGVIVLLNS